MAVAELSRARYLYEQATGGEAERERLRLMGAVRDPHTIRHLEQIGVSDGWRCLDVGAGGGSIARWLGERVGPTGRVVATDLDTTALDHAGLADVDVIRHNILVDDLDADAFDLVHTRYLLLWLPEREEALRRIVSAVRPGGWVLVGDVDVRTVIPAHPDEVFSRVNDAFFETMRQAGADPAYGHKLPAALEAQGLDEVQAEAIRLYSRGGSDASRLWAMTLAGVRDEIAAAELASREEIDEALALLADPGFAWSTATLWLTAARKPTSASSASTI
jgi:2-polyprenyl-3-methyl-5-hydroxy-6-metoxy-1,4-benzoquinol methylase